MKPGKMISTLLGMGAAAWFSSCFETHGASVATERGEADREACIKQLEKTYEAIQAYRRDHKDLPNWLSDLVPKYIPDQNLLVCPVTKKTGRTHTFAHLKDPKMPTAYLYEFCPLPMGTVWDGGQIRMRDFKRRQMGLLGGEVPVVRCHLHERVLNLAFSGRIYESDMNWEENFTDYVEFSAHSMENLFPETRRTPSPAPRVVRTPAAEAEEPGPEKLMGKPAPEISVPLLEGGTFDLAAHKGKQVVLLDFWASWCGPCRVAMPQLVEIARDFADKGVVYAAVNLREPAETIRKYLNSSKLDITVPLDKDGSVAKQYGIRGIPTVVIVDKDGNVKKVHVGSSPAMKEELTRVLNELLSREKQAAAKT